MRVVAIICALVVGGCGSSEVLDKDERRALEPTSKFSLAVGGVAPGRDELVIYDRDNKPMSFVNAVLECKASGDVIELRPRPGYSSTTDGSGVQLVAKKAGVAAVTCTSGGLPIAGTYEVVVAPQVLIQILLAEAGRQIVDEATYDENFTVALDSRSFTAEALAYVVQNRVRMAYEYDSPDIFNAAEDLFKKDPPTSYYEAIISAEGQFSPLNPDNPANEIFLAAEKRANLKDRRWQIAYDQAVLSAASVFAEDIDDPTGGAFAFYSPTEDEWQMLNNALVDMATDLPVGGGVVDTDWPLLEPVQVVILPDIWMYQDGRPSFVFVRKRGVYEAAVVDTP